MRHFDRLSLGHMGSTFLVADNWPVSHPRWLQLIVRKLRLLYLLCWSNAFLVDYLKGLPAVEVARLFRRLKIAGQKHLDGKSLAAEMWLHWLDSGGATKTFCSLKDLPRVTEYLLNEVVSRFAESEEGKVTGLTDLGQHTLNVPTPLRF